MRALTLALGLTVAMSFVHPVPSAALDPDLTREILIREQSRSYTDGFLVGLTSNDDPKVRARAYLALGRLQHAVLIEDLAAGLDDDDAEVRLAAAFAIGQLFEPVGIDRLTTAFSQESDPRVRVRLVEAMGKCGTESTVPQLAELLKHEDPEIARTAAVALGVLAVGGTNISGAALPLNETMRVRDPELQWRAAFAVQRGKVKQSTSGVQTLLRGSTDALPLIFACRAAAELKTRKLVEFVVPLLEHEDWRVRVEALKAMGAARLNFYTSRASLLLDDENEHVRLTAIATMGQLASGGGLGRTFDLEGSSDWRVRAALVRAQATGNHDGALPDIRDVYASPNWRLRVAAADGLAEIKSEPALLMLEQMCLDESPQVQAAVVNALVGYPQTHAVTLNREFLDSDDPAVLTSAANAAGQRFDLSAVAPLVTAYDKLLSPVDTEVMTAILGALGSILTAEESDDPQGELGDGDRERALALLEAARHDSDPGVSLAAADALSRIRGELVDPATTAGTDIPTNLDLELAVALESSDQRAIARIVTNRGTIGIRLMGDLAPGTVANFITLARSGYYNGLTFHRVVADFVIQGGDPRGDGWGGPGYAIRCEYNPLHYGTGMVGMALAGKDTGGSQFFVTQSPTPHLNGRYTIFGEIIDGMDVVNLIQVGDTINEIQLEGI